MWMITEKGFISAVQYKVGKDHTDQLPEVLRPWTPERAARATRKERNAHQKLVENGFILARARVHDDLEQLRPYFVELNILEDKGADYKFRAVVPRQAFADAVADAAWDINYDSHFKEVARDRSPKDANRYSAMMACWTALNRMGDPKPFHTYNGSPYSTGSGRGKGSGSAVVSSGMVSPGRTPAYGDRRYMWEEEFEAAASSATPFGSGPRRQLTSQEALELADFEAEAARNAREVGDVSREAGGDTLKGMIKQLLEKPYEEIDADIDVPRIPYALYEAVFDYLPEAEPTASIEVLRRALSDLLDSDLESFGDPSITRAIFQQALDELDGVSSDQAAVLEAADPRTPCEIAGHHLPQLRHSEANCYANKQRALPGDMRCHMQIAHERHKWDTEDRDHLRFDCPGVTSGVADALSLAAQIKAKQEHAAQ